MARFLADYIVVADSGFTLKRGGQEAREFTVDFPAGTIFDQSMVLQWWYFTNADADLKYRWTLDGTALRTSQLDGNFFGTYHEVIRADFGLDHTLRAEAFSGSGGITLSDVVIWFQREVE